MVSLVLLGIGSSSLVAVLISASVFGVGYMAGSAVLAIWTAQLAPGRATAGFTVALIVGAVTSIAVAVVVGALVGMLGLSALLLTTAATALVVGVVLLLPWAQRTQSFLRQPHSAQRPLDEA
jgi:hypothetical protein